MEGEVSIDLSSAAIKPLFHARDRQPVKFAFDLWSYDDVRQATDGVAQRPRAGSMPCDAALPPEKLESSEGRNPEAGVGCST